MADMMRATVASLLKGIDR